MCSDSERRVLAEIELALRRDDARFVARFDERPSGRRRRRLVEVTCLAGLLVAAVLLAIGAAAAALPWLCLTGCAATVVATVVALGRAMNRRARWPG
jgi:O-antigen/teichoic acid export membrane protein